MMAREMDMSEAEFARLVKGCCEIINRVEDYGERQRQLRAYLDAVCVKPFWAEPIRVMASGGWYYSADEWMAAHTQG